MAAFLASFLQQFQKPGAAEGALPDAAVAVDFIGRHGLDPFGDRGFADLGSGGCDQVVNAAVVNEGFEGIAVRLRRLMGGAEQVARQLA